MPQPDTPPARPGSHPAGRRPTRIWSAPRSARPRCGLPSATASSTRSIARASTFRRFATSASSSPTMPVSGSRSSAAPITRWPCPRRGAAADRRAPPPTLHPQPAFLSDAARDVLLIDLALDGEAGLRVYALLAPHLGAPAGTIAHGRRAIWGKGCCGRSRGRSGALLARMADGADALGAASAGYVGVSDGWQDFAANGRMAWHYAAAGRAMWR